MPDPLAGINAAGVSPKPLQPGGDGPVTVNPAKGPAMNSGTVPPNYQDNADLARLRPLRKTFTPDQPATIDAGTPPTQPQAMATPPAKERGPSGAARVAGGAVKTTGVVGGLGIMALGATKVYAAMTAASLAVPPFAAAVGIVVGGYLLLKVALLAGNALSKGDAKPAKAAGGDA